MEIVAHMLNSQHLCHFQAIAQSKH